MRKVVCKIALAAGLLVMAMPHSYAQDTKKTPVQKESSNDDMETEEETPAEAQAPVQKKKKERIGVGFGMEAGAGVNLLQVSGQTPHVDATGTLGLYADVQMAGRFYVQPGFFYLRNGGSNVVLDRISGYGLDVRITMLEVPVMFAYKGGQPNARVHFTIGAGGYFGYNVGANINGIPLSIGSDVVYDDLKETEAGIGLNVGIELRNGLFFRIKSQRGLTNLQPNPNDPSIYSQSDVLTIGYLWHKHEKRAVRVKGKDDGYEEPKM